MPLTDEQVKKIAEEAAKKASGLRDSDYHRAFQARSVVSEDPAKADEMIIEGRAVVFNETTTLFEYHDSWENVDVRFEEEIDPHAFDGCDKRNLFFKVNHEDSIVPCARYKEGRTGPGTMSLSLREDGLYFQANLANTQTSRDTYELVRSEVLTEMSFAFTISASETTQTEEKREGRCNLITLHRKVTKIDHLYDVSAVCNPAYANTSLYARSRADAEALVREAAEAARQQRMAKLREIGAKALRGEPTD